MKEKLTDFSTKNPWVVILLTLAITAFFVIQLPKMQIDTDPENMLEADEPVRVFDHEVKDEFGLYDFIAVGVVNEKSVFTAAQLERIYNITEEIAEIDGVIADDIMAPSMVDDIRQGDDGSIVIGPLMGKAPADEAQSQHILARIKDNPILRGKLASEDGKAIALFVPIESKDMSHRIAGEMRAITDKYSGGETYHIAGLPVAEDSFGSEMFSQMAISAPLAGLIIFLLMLFFFRQIRIVLAPMIVAVSSVIWTMGLLIVTGHPVHIMSSMIPIFLIPIAVLNSIHIISEFHDRFQKYKHKVTTIKHSIGELFVPMLFTSLTTIVGFLSLALTPIQPVRVFGIFVAVGILIAWFLSLTFNPAFAVLISDKALRNFGAKAEGDSVLGRVLAAVQGFASRRAKPILLVTSILILVSAFGLSLIEVNDNPVRWFKPSHELRIADRELNSHLAGTYMNYLVFDTGEEDAIKNPELLTYIEKMQRHLEKNEIVGATTGITDVVKKVRYELFGGDKAYNRLPDNQAEVAQNLFIFEMSGGDSDDLFKFVTSDYTKANLWVQLTEGDNQSVASVVADADRFLAENQPPVSVDVRWAGLPYVNIVWQEKMVSGMRSSLLSSFVVVFLMMTLLFRSVRWGIISMLPLTITIMMIYAFIGFINKPYDMPVAVLSSLTLGLSIDFAIHYIQRSRTLYKRIGNFKDTLTAVFEGPAQAISRNVLVIAIGFVPMFFSTLVPYITVGSFFFAIMLVSGAVTLVLMPAITTIMNRKLYPAATAAGDGKRDKKAATTKGAEVMKKSTLSILLLAGATALLLAGPAQAQDDATEIMKQSHLAYYYAADDGLSEVTMSIVDKKGKERIRRFTMFRLDESDGGNQKYYTYFQEPSDVRRMTFMVHKTAGGQDQRWLYVPAVDLIKQISADDKNSSFVGSDFTYEDVSGRLWTEDNHKVLREETLNDRPVWVVESTPKEEYKGFSRKLTFVDKESSLPLREEYYDKKDKLERVFTAEKVESADGVMTITVRKMENVEKSRYSVVTFDSIKYDVGIEDKVFTERFLKNPPRDLIQ